MSKYTTLGVPSSRRASIRSGSRSVLMIVPKTWSSAALAKFAGSIFRLSDCSYSLKVLNTFLAVFYTETLLSSTRSAVFRHNLLYLEEVRHSKT